MKPNPSIKEQIREALINHGCSECRGWEDSKYTPEATEEIRDTHRTVTLRIPKGMRIGEAIRQVWMEAANSGYLGSVSDTDLQKALDEVQPNE